MKTRPFTLKYRGGVIDTYYTTSLKKAKSYYKKEYAIERLHKEKYCVEDGKCEMYYDNYDTIISGAAYKQVKVSF